MEEVEEVGFVVWEARVFEGVAAAVAAAAPGTVKMIGYRDVLISKGEKPVTMVEWIMDLSSGFSLLKREVYWQVKLPGELDEVQIMVTLFGN